MDRARLYVDFNEMLEEDLVLLSQKDSKVDSEGNLINIHEGMDVYVYTDDESDDGIPQYLIADGKVEINEANDWSSACKWLCRIDKKGIRRIP